MSGGRKIFVRRADVEGNLLPISCDSEETGTIHDVAQAIINNAHKFDLNRADIKIRTICLFLKDDKGESRKLEFNEPISVIQRNYTVEFYEDQERTFRLAQEVTEMAQKDGSEVALMQIIDGNYSRLNLNTTVRSLEGSVVPFKIKSYSKLLNTDRDAEIQVFIKHKTMLNPIRFQCSEDDRISDLCEKIKQRIADFNLTDGDASEVMKKGNEIILMTIASKQGDMSRVLDTSEKVIDINPRRFEFSVQTRQMRVTTVDDIKEKCNNVNIAFIGAPGHGKSSTINTIIKALSRKYTPLASTWKGAATGTYALTTYPIVVEGKSFKCIDVPGKALKTFENKAGTGKASQVISGIFDGNYYENQPLDYWRIFGSEKKTGKVDVVVYIHKGNAEPDRLGNTVIEVAQKKGRGIPIFVIITHIDVMSVKDVENAVESISNSMGMDNARIFQVANFDHKEERYETMAYSKEDANILRILLDVLSAGDNYRSRGRVRIP